ncbi:hypothetical protein [Microbaculum marinisediminis]|uniref:Uncharacterized protein n=1 Tax=Microbaculum marinisediminis TaxID=2931392 RepID=A0AAW5R7I6_9HYPH|nr:hypothetical protein [Microbaculum sp. A6E488]MCT8974918.1 hypothetical protein [Microbaculum sp. A6E488]
MQSTPKSRARSKTLSAAVVGLTMLAVTATSAGAEEVEYRGSGYLKNFTAACAPKGYGDPIFVNAIYRPRRLGTNGSSTRLSFFLQPFYAMSYELPKGRLGDRFKKVVGGATGTATEFFSTRPRLRLTDTNPGRINLKTTSLSLAGQIDNFDGIKGCRADFELGLNYHP